MVTQFLKTKIGMSLALAVLLITVAVVIKIIDSKKPNNVSEKISLVADASIREVIKNSSYDWEDRANIFDNEATSTSTDSISNLPGIEIPATFENITATDKFSRELFTQYAKAKQDGREIDEATQKNIADSVLSKNYSSNKILLTISDIKTTADISRARLKIYGNQIGEILSTPRGSGDQELLILERIRDQGLTNNDVRVLNAILKRYKIMSDSLLATVVPKDLVQAHVDIINGTGYLSDAVDGILVILTDPIGSLNKIKGYEEGINLLSAGAFRMKVYFKSRDIIFSSDESGYKLTQ